MNWVRKRSIAKAVTYRVLSFVVGAIVISSMTSLAVGTTISLFLVATNTVLFYLHDLGWSKIGWGKSNDA